VQAVRVRRGVFPACGTGTGRTFVGSFIPGGKTAVEIIGKLTDPDA
jgi:hypothetical protein